MRVRVLYVVGSGRSGTTLLDNVLGTLPGYFSTGELQLIWVALRQGSGCGCGLPVAECEVWSKVIQKCREEIPWFDENLVEELVQDELRIRHTPRLLRRLPGRLDAHPGLNHVAQVLRSVYLGAAELTNSRVIVDSSKSPAPAIMLSTLEDAIDPFIVHLVRDPRAVAYSWHSRQPTLDRHRPGEMHRLTWGRSSFRWTATNLMAERVRKRLGEGRSLLVRYEDFIRNPRATLMRITQMMGDEDIRLPLKDDTTVVLGANHTVWGNRSRFITGPVTLRMDRRWEKELPRSVSAGVTALTLPGLMKYGFVRPFKRTA
jgi:hypothetical protein